MICDQFNRLKGQPDVKKSIQISSLYVFGVTNTRSAFRVFATFFVSYLFSNPGLSLIIFYHFSFTSILFSVKTEYKHFFSIISMNSHQFGLNNEFSICLSLSLLQEYPFFCSSFPCVFMLLQTSSLHITHKISSPHIAKESGL